MRSLIALWVLLFVGGLAAPALGSAQGASFACADFNTQEAAQAILDSGPGAATERALDPDGDGQACEDLPSSQGNQPTPKPTVAADEETSTSSNDSKSGPLTARFGGTRDSFETKYGDPTSDKDAGYPLGFEYEAKDFETVNAFYHKNYVAYLTLTADPQSPWTKIKANLLVKAFLPSDVKLDKAKNTGDGNAITTGHSKALEKRFGKSTYEKYGADGDVGDLFYVLRLNDDSKVDSVEIALGSTLQTGKQSSDNNGGALTQEEKNYLTQVRQQFDPLVQSMDDFQKLLDDLSAGTVDSTTGGNQLATIFTLWEQTDAAAKALDAPASQASTQELYTELTGFLAGAAEDFSDYIINGTDASLDSASAKYSQAATLRPLIAALLDASGV
ncbi:MAG: hypothetical protein ACJ789_04605 [Thermomicrobiales bacterium]